MAKTRSCDQCEGSGRVDGGTAGKLTCSSCNGSGFFYVLPTKVTYSAIPMPTKQDMDDLRAQIAALTARVEALEAEKDAPRGVTPVYRNFVD